MVVSRITVAVELANRPNAIPELWTWWIANGPTISTSSPTSSCRATTCFVSWSAAIAAPATSASASHWRRAGAKEPLGSRNRLERVRRRSDAHLGRAPRLGRPRGLAHSACLLPAAARRRSASSSPIPESSTSLSRPSPRDDAEPGEAARPSSCARYADQGAVGATTLGRCGDPDLPGVSVAPDTPVRRAPGETRTAGGSRAPHSPRIARAQPCVERLAGELLGRRLLARCGRRDLGRRGSASASTSPAGTTPRPPRASSAGSPGRAVPRGGAAPCP